MDHACAPASRSGGILLHRVLVGSKSGIPLSKEDVVSKSDIRPGRPRPKYGGEQQAAVKELTVVVVRLR